MYTKKVTIPIATIEDIEKFHRENPLFTTLEIEVTPEKVAAYFAMKNVNNFLPVQETGTKIHNAVENSDETITFDVKILD